MELFNTYCLTDFPDLPSHLHEPVVEFSLSFPKTDDIFTLAEFLLSFDIAVYDAKYTGTA